MPVIRLKSFLFLILAAFLCQLLPFLLNTSHAEPIRLDSSRERIPVAGQLELLKDEEGSLTITDITTLPVMARFKPIPGNHLSGFAQHGAVWLRITVIRPSDSPSPWLLEVNPAYHEQLQLYFRSDLQGYDRRDGGALLPFSKREIPYRLDLFRLYPPVDQPWTVYLRIVSKRTILSHLTFWQPDGLKKHAIAESLAHGAYLGILLLIICLNVQYALRLNKLLYLYYSAYVLAMAVIFLDFNGYLHQFLITDRTWFLSPCIRLNLILLMVSNVGVLSHLVDLKPLFPKINMFFSRFFLNMAALFTILVLAGQSDKIVILVLDTLLASAIISAGISVYLCFHRIMGAKLYLAAFGMLLLTGSAKILTFFDFVPEIFPADLFWISSLVHILIMNLAVTNRITQYRQDKLKFEAELAAERSTMNLQREFLQLISHELRTPLAIIDSTAQILPMVNTDQSVFKHKTATILEALIR